ncbi:MAG: hypothetical protein Q8O00_10550 [Holophaga sp.]|nr:hypothetical protein [Holophaga sp.]
MRLWSLLNARNPLWKYAGWATLAALAGVSGYFIHLGPKPLAPKSNMDIFKGYGGKYGTITEQLGEGRVFVLDHESISGDMKNLELTGVKARLEEPDALWRLASPSGQRTSGAWTLQGPMQVEANANPSGTALGRGNLPNPGPALRWEKGIWTGLSDLEWQDLSTQGKGRWNFPAGWRRELDGRFVANKGPIIWQATEPSTVQRMEAERLWLTQGFQNGQLDGVMAQLTGGRIWAGQANLEPETVRWSAPVRFERSDGWAGTAESGYAPRPKTGQSINQIELKGLRAQRPMPEGSEKMQAQGTRWTAAGLRLEGQVSWEQPLDGERLMLKAPRVLIREGAGTDLPETLPIGEAWGEGFPVLTWGSRSLSSPRMRVRRAERGWWLQAPVLGRGEQGTFSAGPGHGTPKRWEFEGPISAKVLAGGELRGNHLLWESDTWTITGNLATWTRLRERLSGLRIVRKGNLITFPKGISGSLASVDGDFSLRADTAEYLGTEINLVGHVECRGSGWRLTADRISVRLGPGSTVKQINAKGSVTLKGSLGEGWGESLELEPDPVNPKARWQGRVRGLAEVNP